MNRHELIEWTGAHATGPVEVRVPAEAHHLSLIRTVARHVAEREGFAPDGVTDVTVAVDEAAACLVSYSVPGALLACRFTVVFGSLRVAVSATTEGGKGPPHGFGWWVLHTVTDSLSAWRYDVDPQRGAGRVVHIDFAKQFARHTPG